MGRSADMPRVHTVSGGDDTGCTILHVDMDAFFASVEIRRRPELRGKPVLVGGSVRGVVSAASYEARRYGIRSAMPMSQALRRCPHAIVLPPDGAAYAAASATVMAVLRTVTPVVEPLSLDEAFLDIAGATRLLGPPAGIAARIRAQVAAETGLSCSVGVASTKFVAKLASARCKPDGLLVVPAARTLAFLEPLPVTVLWGVGAKTAQPLHRLGVRTVGDLAQIPPDALRRAVGTAVADHLHALSHGLDPRTVEAQTGEKSISADHTTSADLTDPADVRLELLRLADEVGRRVRGKGLAARTVGIKIRFADFRTVSRVRTLPGWTDSTEELHRCAVELYESLELDQPRIRLVGVKAEGLRAAEGVAEQLQLDLQPTAAPQASQRRLSRPQRPARRGADSRRTDAAVDLARARFGAAALRPASLIGSTGDVSRRLGQQSRRDVVPDDAPGEDINFRPQETARMLD